MRTEGFIFSEEYSKYSLHEP